MISSRTSTNNAVGSDAGPTGIPSQLTSVQPPSGLPCTTTAPVLGTGWVSSSSGWGLSTFIIVPTPMVNALE
ncbi:Uncharacterised protein [Mycobacterium tuberculosis]|uniref:Uncharacterized protein n=1 Tax=Mycobacterium tuberculosis TaxID=1773 RepID=A0A655FPA7_MYCTX|nr:Uncharacterised protein [Mycobacterium tuberculosis]CKQ10899.1 Uncharacterised protein [Mycobacterium tuberculosis]CKT38571.1 Uncharacterised protein [Mycobacterium tuberculosis]CNV89592.1 Uncharacterised protein [Mycobacterium tuberculosis]COX67171.1 Uncharacterised protein [Mycobacterium tuberculosis]